MFYYLYEIRNNLNGKIYVGVHKTNDMNDGYMGSGKVIRRAIEKYGVENFTKTVLEEFGTAEEMFAREKEVVNDEFLLREDVYNLRRGGFGGFEFINKNGLNLFEHLSAESQQKHREAGRRSAIRLRDSKRGIHGLSAEDRVKNSKKGIKKLHEVMLEKHGVKSFFGQLNKLPSFQEKRKQAFADIGHQQGEKNSQYGTMWITNEIESIKIMKSQPIPQGWRKGRKIKK
jgi:hypothetical protein